jgi:hypothetical protein
MASTGIEGMRRKETPVSPSREQGCTPASTERAGSERGRKPLLPSSNRAWILREEEARVGTGMYISQYEASRERARKETPASFSRPRIAPTRGGGAREEETPAFLYGTRAYYTNRSRPSEERLGNLCPCAPPRTVQRERAETNALPRRGIDSYNQPRRSGISLTHGLREKDPHTYLGLERGAKRGPRESKAQAPRHSSLIAIYANTGLP